MLQIKFSHSYDKLTRKDRLLKTISKACLISVCKLDNLKSLPAWFIDYDSVYFINNGPGSWKRLNYPLDLNKSYLILTFFDAEKFFTTIRPWNKQKEEYYRGLIGQEFQVVIKEETK